MSEKRIDPCPSVILETVGSSDELDQIALANVVAGDWQHWAEAVLSAFGNDSARRWARRFLLPGMDSVAATDLAARLLDWEEDFHPERRDRSTAMALEFLALESMLGARFMLAGSNAAGAFWDRLNGSGDDFVESVARDVLARGDARARETTLHLLVLDPYGPQFLSREQQDGLLRLALDDADPEIRGLAAEVVAVDMPEMLLDRWDDAPLDESERLRMAFWRAALVHRLDLAHEHAGKLCLDPHTPKEARRSALLALGEHLSTREFAPVLQVLLRGDDEVLAEDAAQLMWRHHRAPDIANAAAESQFQSVRELAKRLLHPELGSPAAGGSRPGDPTKTTDIFDQISSSREWRGPDPDEDDRRR